jgi:hypothetical protein
LYTGSVLSGRGGRSGATWAIMAVGINTAGITAKMESNHFLFNV